MKPAILHHPIKVAERLSELGLTHEACLMPRPKTSKVDMMTREPVTRLEKTVAEGPRGQAQERVYRLWSTLWEECKLKTDQGPGAIFGEAMKEAGFNLDDTYESDRYRMAVSVQGAAHIAARVARELGL